MSLQKLNDTRKKIMATFRQDGFKGLVRTYGWKTVAAIFVFYLVRDLSLYIVLPWLAAKGIWSLSK